MSDETESEKFLKKYYCATDKDWLYVNRVVIAKLLEAYHSEQLSNTPIIKNELTVCPICEECVLINNACPKCTRELCSPLSKTGEEMHLNMQYYMEHCQRNGYVTPKEWIEKHKHF